jgi:hypothetical protein
MIEKERKEKKFTCAGYLIFIFDSDFVEMKTDNVSQIFGGWVNNFFSS